MLSHYGVLKVLISAEMFDSDEYCFLIAVVTDKMPYSHCSAEFPESLTTLDARYTDPTMLQLTLI